MKLTVTDRYSLEKSISRSVNVLSPSKLVNLKWTAALGGAVKGGSSPTLSTDGLPLWVYDTAGGIPRRRCCHNRRRHALCRGGPDPASGLIALRPDGTEFGQTKLGVAATAAPVMDAQGRMFTVVNAGGVETVVCATSKAASYSLTAPWAMRGQNPCRTGLQN